MGISPLFVIDNVNPPKRETEGKSPNGHLAMVFVSKV